MFFFKLCLFIILKGVSTAKHRTGLQLWRAQGNFDDNVLNNFHERESKGQEMWVRDNRTIDFVLFKEEKEKVSAYLKEHGMNYSVLIENLSEKLDDDVLQTFPTKRSAVSGDSFTWKEFPLLREINAYLVRMAEKYPRNCELSLIGKTHHRLPIYMLKISNGQRYNHAVLVDAGMHGREYISVISVLYFIDTIVRDFRRQPAHMTKRDWYIIPLMNPDGYNYSLSSDRMWKKNRRCLSGGCCGVDINRNFEYNFELADDDLCSIRYCGPVPFSELESKAFKKVAEKIKFYGYLSVHSAGSKVLYPMRTERDDHDIHLVMTKEMARAMQKVNNYIFETGDIRVMRLNSFGMSLDWMYFIRNVKHSYFIVTRGQMGLDYTEPKDSLLAAKEVVAAVRKFAEKL